MNIYLASSWRNANQPRVRDALRRAGHEVYDFRNPAPGNVGFTWSQCGNPKRNAYGHMAPDVLANTLRHPIARAGFDLDMGALQRADATVLLLPCGKSAHLEAGFAAARCSLFVLLDVEPAEPELMYSMAEAVVWSLADLLGALRTFGSGA